MSLTLDNNNAHYQIRGYKPGAIHINEDLFTRSVIISPDQLITDWEPQSLPELTAAHLNIMSTLHPQILLIGTGATLEFPALEIYGDLLNQGIGVEIMDTHAACRTYNALTAEGRPIVAALLIR